MDERAWVLHRQGKIAFHISSIRQEAAQVGAVYAIEKGKDWLVPYYRDLAMMIGMGMTPTEFVMKEQFIEQGLMTEEDYLKLEEKAKKSVDEAVEAATRAPYPKGEEAATPVYAKVLAWASLNPIKCRTVLFPLPIMAPRDPYLPHRS